MSFRLVLLSFSLVDIVLFAVLMYTKGYNESGVDKDMSMPLAAAIRPRELSDVCGQKHLLSEDSVFRRAIEKGVVNKGKDVTENVTGAATTNATTARVALNDIVL